MISMTTIIECFFGENVKDEKIDGLPLHTYINNLVMSLGKLRLNPFTLIFSKKSTDYGITKIHRDFKKKCKKYQ